MDNEITRLDRLLSRIQVVDVPYTAEGKELYEEICELALRDKLYRRI